VRAYQLHLIAQQRSWSHINQVVCALRFFYGKFGKEIVFATEVRHRWDGAERRRVPALFTATRDGQEVKSTVSSA
jgi:hypothetical protein